MKGKGKGASPDEKRFGFIFAKKYQDMEKRTKNLPIITLDEGQMQPEIDMCLQ